MGLLRLRFDGITAFMPGGLDGVADGVAVIGLVGDDGVAFDTRPASPQRCGSRARGRRSERSAADARAHPRADGFWSSVLFGNAPVPRLHPLCFVPLLPAAAC